MSDPKILGMPMMGELPTKAEPSRLVINSCPTDSMPTSIAEYIEEARERRAGGQRLVSANEIANSAFSACGLRASAMVRSLRPLSMAKPLARFAPARQRRRRRILFWMVNGWH